MREGAYDFQCLHSSVEGDVFFKRKGQTSSDLWFALVHQSSTINWHPLQTQTSFRCKASLETSRVQAFLPPVWEFPFQVLPGNGPRTDCSCYNASISHSLLVKAESMETSLWKEKNQNCRHYSKAKISLPLLFYPFFYLCESLHLEYSQRLWVPNPSCDV